MSRKKKGKLKQVEASMTNNADRNSIESHDDGNGTAHASLALPSTKADGTVIETERFRPIHGNFRNYYAIRGRSQASQTAHTAPESSAVAAVAPLASSSKAVWTAAGSAVLPIRARDDIDPRVRQFLNWAVAIYPARPLPFDRVLDIGCNSGQVTLELGQALEHVYSASPTYVLGVDIDAELIRQAKDNLVKAQQAASRDGGEPARKRRRMDALALPIPVQKHSISIFKPRNLKKKSVTSIPSQSEPLAASTSAIANPVDFAAEASSSQADALSKISFTTIDWVNESPGQTSPWDLILGLSLTKWVHINGGTKGILKLFARIATELAPPSPAPTQATSHDAAGNGAKRGGVFLLEPQAWSSYQTARSQGADVRARIRALQSPVPLDAPSVKPAANGSSADQAPSDPQQGLSARHRKRKRKRGGAPSTEPANGAAAAEDPSESSTAGEDAQYGYPPIHPDDFPYLLTTVFGLEGPIEVGHAQGAGFLRPLQAYSQPDPQSRSGTATEAIASARQAALGGELAFCWVPRPFK
ncbi:hypothetical protein V8E36_003471 [Tilletia maclaganii]